MTDTVTAALVRCREGIGERELVAMRMLRHVAHAERVALPTGEIILAVLERPMRDDDFAESLCVVLGTLAFVREFEPVTQVHADLEGHRMQQEDAVTRLIRDLRPDPAGIRGVADLSAFSDRIRAWRRTRDILDGARDAIRSGGLA